MGRAAVVGLALWLAAMVSGGSSGAASVAPRWRVAAEGRGTPVISGSTIYFLGKRHQVVAVDAATGAVRWARSTGEPGDETLGSSLLIAGDVVMAGDYAIVAFDRATGAARWRFDPADGYGPGLYLGGGQDGLAFAGSPSGHLFGVRTADGALAWMVQPVAAARTTMFQPIVAGDTVAAGYSTFAAPVSGGVVVVDRVSGRVRWHHEFPRRTPGAATGFGGGPVVSGDLLIAGSGDGQLYGFDRATGAQRWVLPPVTRADGRIADRDWRALAVSGRSLVAGSVTGIVTRIDLDGLREKWRYAHPEGGSIALRITADERSVYLPHLGGLLVALGLQDGQPRWEIGGWDDGFNWAPAVSGETTYAAGSRGGLFAFPR